jgi:hypothetical protein
VARLPYLKNSFVVLHQWPRTSLAAAVAGLAQVCRDGLAGGRVRAFRLMAHVDGELTAIPARARLEAAIAAATGARVSPRGGGDEFWILARQSLGQYLFARRLGKPDQGRARPPGSLAPELAHLLVRLAAPRPADRFLDPFGGSGALVWARSQYPARSLTYSDQRPGLPGPPPGARTPGRAVRVLHDDALRLPSVADQSVDVIVTDPPWGEFEQYGVAPQQFLADTALSFRRVLAEGGRLVLVMSRRLDHCAAHCLARAGFAVDPLVPILVNGHPATVIMASVEGSGRSRTTNSARS